MDKDDAQLLGAVLFFAYSGRLSPDFGHRHLLGWANLAHNGRAGRGRSALE